MGRDSRSIVFDQAAEYYDATRSLQPATQAAVIDHLAAELRGRGRCLEVGVGTGRIALDLHARGIPMAGVDLSTAMLAKLVQKAGGRPPFPLAVADATALPVADAGVGAAVVCHVLHLVDPWQRAAEELVRVIRPGGVLLFELAERTGGPLSEMNQRFWSLASPTGRRPVPGLTDMAALDTLLRALGLGQPRLLPPVVERYDRHLGDVLDRLEAGIVSGCWGLSEATRRDAAATTREWARQRFGDLDAPRQFEETIRWRAYDAPAST